jgi:hypothetical protein
MSDDRDESSTGIDAHFFRLVATFEAAAMQQLGKIAHPLTGDVEVSLGGARDSIDMLDMLSHKTEGNLNDDERQLLEHVLYQLRMNYVDVKREADSEPESAPSSDDSQDDGSAAAAGEGGEEDASSESDDASS